MNHAARLDRLPFTYKHGKLVLGSGFGWALDAMDVGLISFIIAQLVKSGWQGIDSTTAGWIASAGFIGMAIGATFGGLLADKIGRRQVFALTLLIYGLATGASGLAGTVAVLIALRVVVGLGLGAELPVASTLVSEFAPARIRGRIIVVLEAFWALGWLFAALIGYFVVPVGDNGWRWALALGAVPAIYALVIRMGLPESVRFLGRKGRFEQAEKIVEDFESSRPMFNQGANVAPEIAHDAHIAAEPEIPEPPAKVSALWATGLRGRAAVIGLIWFFVNFSYYGAFIWLPSLLVMNGIAITKSFGYTLIITLAQLPGYACAAITIEKWGRRPTLIIFLAGSAIAAGLFAFAFEPWAIIAAGMTLSFFNLGAWGALYATTPELFPTDLRGAGSGWAAGFGRIASIIAPLIVPALMGLGTTWLFFLFGISFLVACFLSLLLPELKGQSLE
ncbi:MAG: MFS transporter [Propionibacteriaceae bacterium]|jgi:putative MFS transporter|nr:MFS transporter [Propionibacteriaceae bacterium]